MRYWFDRLLASDPSLDRLRTGARALLTAAAASALLLGLAHALQLEPKLALMGVIVPLMSAVAVQDTTPRQQRLVMAGLPAVAIGAVALGSWLGPDPWATGACFLLVIFAAFEARRFGPPGAALGTIAYQAFFYALLLKTGIEDLAWSASSILLGSAVAWGVRFGLLPGRPPAVLRQDLRALRARLATLLQDMADGLGGQGGARARKRADAGLVALHDLCLDIDGRLAQFTRDRDDAASSPADAELRDRLLLNEIAIETLSTAAHRAAEHAGQQTAGMRRVLLALRDAIRNSEDFDADRLERESAAGLPLGTDLRWRFWHSVRSLASEPAWSAHLPHLEPKQARKPRPAARAASPRSERHRLQVDEPTRQAVQATVSALCAIVVGHAISSDHWYWAVFAAFIVFTRAISVGQTLSGAGQRIVANVAGVALGLALTDLTAGSHVLQLVLLFLFIGPAFYAFRGLQPFYALLLTAMLGLLYNLLGQHVEQMLTIRLEETLAGAVIAVAGAALVFPVRAQEHSDQESAALLREASRLLEGAFEMPPKAAPRDALRDLDRHLQSLRQALGPVTTIGYPGSTAPHRRRLQQLTLVVYCIRHLYRASTAHPDQVAAEGALRGMAGIVASNAAALADSLEGKPSRGSRPLPTPVDDSQRPRAGRTRVAERWVRQVDAVLQGIHPAARRG